MKQRIIVVLVLLSFVFMAQSNIKTVETEKVKIEIWSDIVCPYCFLGKKKLENAIAKLHAEDKVEIIWHSFQLDPDFPMDTSISTSIYLIERRGFPRKQVSQMTAQLVEQGKGYGIDFQFDKAHSFNTFDAHRLIQWAKKEDKSHELKEAFMIKYFTHGLDLSVTENLMSIIEEVGLDTVKAKQILESKTYSDEVIDDINRSRQLGIRGVPFFLINGKASISGAQSDMVFEKELAAAL